MSKLKEVLLKKQNKILRSLYITLKKHFFFNLIFTTYIIFTLRRGQLPSKKHITSIDYLIGEMRKLHIHRLFTINTDTTM